MPDGVHWFVDKTPISYFYSFQNRHLRIVSLELNISILSRYLKGYVSNFVYTPKWI